MIPNWPMHGPAPNLRGQGDKLLKRVEANRIQDALYIKWAKQFGTPLYVYDGDRIRYKVRLLREAIASNFSKFKLHYALKANSNLNVIKLLKEEGLGAECISAGEMRLAVKLGYRGDEILFTSSSKAPDELNFAVDLGATINLDSLGDFQNLADVLKDRKETVHVSFRVNPDVDPKTHKHIATGHKFTKFGILLNGEEFIQAFKGVKEHPQMIPVGIHSHVGSQITDPEPMRRNAQLLIHAVKRLKRELGIELKFIDLGGGLGIPYQKGQSELDVREIAASVANLFKSEFASEEEMPELWMEPGRFFVGDSGVLVTRVNSVKHTPHTHFINVDTGFNHQLRPLLYEAYHEIRVLGRDSATKVYDIAGNICETGDILAEDRSLPTPEHGDFLAIENTGAYGFSMASEYNSFLLPAEILVFGETPHVIRKRESFEDLLRNQVMIERFPQ